MLQGVYPNYVCGENSLRKTHGQRTFLHKCLRMLPAFMYDKIRGPIDLQLIERSIHEFLIRENVGCLLAEYGFFAADITPHAKKVGVPLLVHFHGHDAYHREYLHAYQSRMREMFEYATTVFVVSEHMLEQVLKLGARKASVVLNPYGPREHFFDVTRNPDGPIMALGRFAEVKAPYLTLLAFAGVLSRRPSSRLCFIGDGPLLPACRDIVKAMRMEHAVNLRGSVSPSMTSEYFARASIFIQHSITASDGVMEGTPVAILEASAAGLPVVATKHAGIPQAVVHGETGFLVDERDVSGMTDFVIELLDDRTLCDQLGTRGREHVNEHFSQRQHIGRIQLKIDECLSSHEGNRNG